MRAILAEDYIIGRRFEKAGRKVVLAAHPVWTVNASWGVTRFLARHVRWCQIRRRIALVPFVPAPLTREG